MEKAVRVLVVVDYINSNSGVSSVVMNYYSNIDKSKVQMDFLLYENPEKKVLEYLEGKGSNVYAFGHPVKMGIGSYQKTIDTFFKMHQNQYHIVHVHIPNAAFVILKYAKKYGVGTRIIHSHNSRGADGLLKRMRNFVLNKQGVFYANQYYACSKSAGEYLYGRKREHQVTVINNAIDLKKYSYNSKSRNRIRNEFGIGDELVLGHVGRFSEQKNHQFLIRIASELKKNNICFKLVLLGDGEMKEKIQEQVKLLHLDDHVIFTGIVDNVKEYMDAMDIFLLPSLYEGLPCVCVEAQANGLPCILSESITSEVALMDTVHFLGIVSEVVWARKILEIFSTLQFKKQREKYHLTGLEQYDITIQTKILEEKYLCYGTIKN